MDKTHWLYHLYLVIILITECELLRLYSISKTLHSRPFSLSFFIISFPTHFSQLFRFILWPFGEGWTHRLGCQQYTLLLNAVFKYHDDIDRQMCAVPYSNIFTAWHQSPGTHFMAQTCCSVCSCSPWHHIIRLWSLMNKCSHAEKRLNELNTMAIPQIGKQIMWSAYMADKTADWTVDVRVYSNIIYHPDRAPDKADSTNPDQSGQVPKAAPNTSQSGQAQK